MSKCVRLRPIAYGYSVALDGCVLGSTIRVRTSTGQEWASKVTVGGNAPLPGQNKTLLQAARQIIKFIKTERYVVGNMRYVVGNMRRCDGESVLCPLRAAWKFARLGRRPSCLFTIRRVGWLFGVFFVFFFFSLVLLLRGGERGLLG